MLAMYASPVQLLSKMLPNHLELHPPNQESQVGCAHQGPPGKQPNLQLAGQFAGQFAGQQAPALRW